MKNNKKMPFVPGLPTIDPSSLKKQQSQSKKKTQNILRVSHDEEDSPLQPRSATKGSHEQVSMKDYEDLMGKQYKLSVQAGQKQLEQFEKMKNEMRSNPQIKEEEFEDELDDQMADSLFKEADQMGIFEQKDAVDYAQALQNV